MTKQETTGFYQFERPCQRQESCWIHDDESAVINLTEQEGSTRSNWVGPYENCEESMLWHQDWRLRRHVSSFFGVQILFLFLSGSSPSGVQVT